MTLSIVAAPGAVKPPAGPRLGVHLSLGANPRMSLTEAAGQGVECIQIFASSPGAWKPPLLDPARVASFLEGRAESDISPAFIHAIYLINLASADPLLVRRSRSSLRSTLQAAETLRAHGVVTHLGSHGGQGFDEVAEQVAEGLAEVAGAAPEGVFLIVENSAGAGGILGSDLAELGMLLRLAGNHPRLRVAIDTAHLCGAGWDFTDPRAADRLVETVEATFGLDRLAVIHCNDSKAPPGSRRDRHARVGEGYIGLEGFRHLLAQPALTAVPWILETPDLDTRLPAEERMVSIRTLRSLTE